MGDRKYTAFLLLCAVWGVRGVEVVWVSLRHGMWWSWEL